MDGQCLDCGRWQELPPAESGYFWLGWCMFCVKNHSRSEKNERVWAWRDLEPSTLYAVRPH